jgi:hypothetical protein
MRIASKGRVIIQQDVRDLGRKLLEALRGTAETRMGTDEIMAMTRESNGCSEISNAALRQSQGKKLTAAKSRRGDG